MGSIQTSSLPRSILLLDKSEEPFETLLTQAGEILDIQSTDDSRYHARLFKASAVLSPFVPLDEWALKWLLKRFQEDTSRQDSPCLSPRAWSLIQALIIRMPISDTARLMRMHKFTSILQKIFQYLQNCEAPKIDLHVSTEKGKSTPKASLINVDSSSGTVGNVSPKTRSKKRKRETKEAFAVHPVKSTITRIIALFESVCGVINRLMEFTHFLPDGSRGYAMEHMRAALRTSPEDAAIILGRSLRVATVLLNHNSYANEAGKSNICVIMAPMMDFWTLSYAAWDEELLEASNRSFSAECLISSLTFLVAVRKQTSGESGFVGSDNSNVDERVQTLIHKLVILPFRASYLDKMRKGNLTQEETPKSQIMELLRPLAGISIRDCNSAPLLGLKACLFGIALDCCSRETDWEQRRENPWLQCFLDQLVKHEPISTDEPTNNDQSPVNKVDIIPLLQQIVRTKIPVKTSTLEAVLTNYSSLFGNYRRRDSWEVTSLCLQANTDVFLFRQFSTETDRYTITKRNRFLDALLMNMTQDCLSISSDSRTDTEERYDIIATVSRLLARAFADARDLSSFIMHWHEQLLQTSQTAKLSLSVWEDEQLIQAVKDLAKLRLTISQTTILLEQLHNEFERPDNSQGVCASCVGLDCLIWGCSEETTNPELLKVIQSIYLSILLLLKGNSHSKGQWRLWRVAALILERWPQLTNSTALSELLDRASLHLGRAMQPQRYNESANHDEALHAFRFAITFSYNESSLLSRLMSKKSNALRMVLDTLEPFCNPAKAHEIDEPEYIWFMGWDGRTETVKSRESLALGCVAQVLYSPSTLGSLEDDLKRRFIETLFWSAYTQIRIHRQQGLVRYDVLWDHLLGSEHVREDHTISNSVRRVLSTCLALSPVGTPMEENCSKRFEDSGNKFIAKTLLQVPFHVFDRDIRCKATNHLSAAFHNVDKYAYGPHMLDGTLQHLNGLTRLMEYPSLNMSLIKDSMALWDIANVLQCLSAFSGMNISLSLVETFYTLIHRVLCYVVSAIDNHQSKGFLQHLYNLIVDKKNTMLAVSNEQAHVKHKTHIFFHVLISKTLVTLQIHAAKVFKKTDIQRSAFSQLAMNYKYNLSIKLEKLVRENQPVLGWAIDDLCITIGILLGCIIDYGSAVGLEVDMTDDYPKYHSNAPMITEIEDFLSTHAERLDIEGCFSQDFLKVKLARMLVLLPNSKYQPTAQILQAGKLQGGMKSRVGSRLLSKYTRQAMVKLNSEQLQELLSALLRNKRYLGSQKLRILHDLIVMKQGALNSISDDNYLQIYVALCCTLRDPSCPSESDGTIIILRCMEYILRYKAATIRQPNIDDAMSAIAIVVKRQIRSQDSRASVIYIKLCSVFSTVLASHRTRLGGRHHLIIAALDALLRVLFIPYSHTSSLSTNTSFWRNQATAYARLLTTICNPSPSAVTSKRKGTQQQLNDITKKERRIVGDLLRVVIQEYCVCQLTGRLMPDVREALMPGIYAVFAVMPDDVKRVISAALEPESRSIYQALWREWKTFGDKWDGT